MTRLCILAAALAVIARTRVPVLPGWVVPLPVLLTFALFALAVTVVTRAVCYRPRLAPSPAGPGVPEEVPAS